MKLLVTGGAGFMGSNFIRYILNKYKNYKIINLDKLTYAGNLDNLKTVKNNKNYSFVKGDICNKKLVDLLIKDTDAIINYAAETHVDRSIMNPSAFIKTDILGIYHLLETAKKHKISRFVQISTDEVFGSINNRKFKENSPFEPNSPYAASKAGADLLCRSYIMTYHAPIIITHSCNFFGPFHYPEKFIPLSIINALQNKKIPVYGDGHNIRQWIFTEDHCRAIDTIVHQGKLGETYNIASDGEWKNIDVAKLILKILGKKDNFVQFIKDRPGHDRRYSLDTTKIERELNWKPIYNFEEALKKTINWYQQNPSWWKKIIKRKSYQNYYQKQYSTS